MVFSFSKFIFKLFPSYYKENDNFVVSGEGLFERYTNVFDESIDEEIVPKVENLVRDVIDINSCDARFLNHIAYTLGNPPDVINNEQLYRKLLSYIVSIYKIKGTIPSYWYFFNLLGYQVTITEYPCIDILYDDGRLYDFDGVNYDKYCCGCSEYSLAFRDLTDNCSANIVNPISQTILDNLYKVVFFLEPINAKLRFITHWVKFCEEFTACYEDEIVWETRAYTAYDSGYSYDDGGITYDQYQVLDTGTTTEDSCSPNPILGPFLLQENGDLLLQENGFNIIIS